MFDKTLPECSGFGRLLATMPGSHNLVSAAITLLLLWVNCVSMSAQTVDEALVEVRKQLKNENVAAAYRLAQKAVSQAPDSSIVNVVLGEVDFRRGEIAAAEMDFKKAIRLDEKMAPAWLGLGHVFHCASMYKRAQICYRKAHDLDPSDPGIVRAWAGTLARPERLTALEQYLRLASDGEDPETVAAVKRFIETNKQFAGRKLNRQVSDYSSSAVKFAPLLYDPRLIRAFGLPVSINSGKPMKLLLDTGASGILINRRAAERVAVQRIAEMKFGGIGDQGDQTGYTALADRVRIGEVEFQDYVIEVSDKKSVADEDGLVGTDVFGRFLVTLDFYKRELRLDPLPKHQVKAAEDEPEDREIASEMKSFAPVFRFGHSLLISTKVSDSGPVWFLIDTGSSQTMIARDFAQQVTKVHADSNTTMKGISGKVKNVYTADRFVLGFAGYRQKNEDAISVDLGSVSKSMGTEVSGILGLPVLSLFVVKIDYRDGLVDFDYQGPKQ